MSTLTRIQKVKGGYKVRVSCTNTPREERVFSTSEECHAFADEYLEKNYFGVSLNSIHHPEGDGVVPESLNPDSLETIEIEIPMTPEQILRNLDNGYVMNRAEQAEAAAYIRQLQQSNEALKEGMNERLKELVRQAKPSPNLIWEDAELVRFAELIRADEREACAALCDEWFASTAGRAIRERGRYE